MWVYILHKNGKGCTNTKCETQFKLEHVEGGVSIFGYRYFCLTELNTPGLLRAHLKHVKITNLSKDEYTMMTNLDIVV